MNDKEILAELKKSYEYLNDIRENGCFDHCNGQLDSEMINKLNIAKRNIEDVYFSFYKTLNIEDLRVYSLEDKFNKVYISSDVGDDYDTDDGILTCMDEYRMPSEFSSVAFLLAK